LGLQSQKRFINSVHVDFFGNQVDGDGYGGYNHVGMQFGLGTLVKFDKGSKSIGFEINYAQKGARKWPRIDEGDNTSFVLRLNYVEVPLFFVFDSWGIPFEIGPVFSYLIDAPLPKYNGIQSPQNQVLREFEIGGMFGLNYKISEKLYFKFRITNSITPIYEADPIVLPNWLAGGWHRGAGVNLTYFFNSPNFKKEGLAPAIVE
jgi:hypothetical protein